MICNRLSFDRQDDRMTANMDPCYKVSSKFLNGLWLLSFIIWLAPWAGKMKLSCLLGTTCYILEQIFYQKPYNKSFIIQSRWLDIGLVLFFASLWTSTSSRSIHVNTHTKKNLANIQPFWPHTCSITHMSFPLKFISSDYLILSHLIFICLSRVKLLATYVSWWTCANEISTLFLKQYFYIYQDRWN